MRLIEDSPLNPNVQLYRADRISSAMLLWLLRERRDDRNVQEREDLVRGYALIAMRKPKSLSESDLIDAYKLIIKSIDTETGFREFTNMTYGITGPLIELGLKSRNFDVFSGAVNSLLYTITTGTGLELTMNMVKHLKRSLRSKNNECRSLSEIAHVALSEHFEKGNGMRKPGEDELMALFDTFTELLQQVEVMKGFEPCHKFSPIKDAERSVELQSAALAARDAARKVRNIVENPGDFHPAIRRRALNEMRSKMPLVRVRQDVRTSVLQ